MKKLTVIVLCLLVLLSGCSASSNSNDVIHIDEDLNELVVTYPDGLTETIMDSTFLSMFKEGINNQLVLTKIDKSKYELIYSIDIDGKSYECFDLNAFNSLYNTGIIKINDLYYKKKLVSNAADNMFNLIKLAHSLQDGSMEHLYSGETEVSSIEELFSNFSISQEKLKLYNTIEYSDYQINGNGTKSVYDLNTDEYLFTFFDMRTMSNNQLTYNWTNKKATLGSCEYNRSEENYSNCTL